MSTFTQELWIAPTPQHNTMSSFRKSFLGSVKQKISRKGTNGSQKSAKSFETEPVSRGRTPSQIESQATTSTMGQQAANNNNPFANLSPPTRRPGGSEPPPAYTPNPTSDSGPSIPAGGLGASNARGVSPAPSNFSAISVSTPEDPYAFLSSFDTIFVIDDSGSMAGRSWREVNDALRVISPICAAHDPDGLDLYFLNHRSQNRAIAEKGKAAGGYRNLRLSEEVTGVFGLVRPGGGTPTGTRLH
jgi:hypothetical protein